MKKILIIEDDQLVATAYKKRFLEAGYEVEWAPDGLEGIKMVSSVQADVVLLDLLMPRLDGIEVLKYIRSHADLKDLPVVVFSNSYMTNLVENAWRAGADQCLMKASTTPAQLFDVVNKAIAKAAARKAASANVPAGGTAVNPLARAAAGRPPATAPLTSPPLPNAPGPRPPVAISPVVPIAPVSPIPPQAKAPATLAPPASASPAPAAAPPEVDPEFQAQIRQLFLSNAPAKFAAIRDAANAVVQDQGSSMQLPLLNDLFRKVHSLTGNAAVAGCAQIARYTSLFEAFLQELQQKPKFINDSTVTTVAKSAEFLQSLAQDHEASTTAPNSRASILVVEAEPMSGQAIVMAVEKAEYRASIASDPVQALTMLSSEPFDAVVMAVNLPSMSGFELCAQMQGLPSCARNPVMFVTSLNDFPSHAKPEVLGGNDLIATPFLLIELTLKAVTQIERSRRVRQS